MMKIVAILLCALTLPSVVRARQLWNGRRLVEAPSSLSNGINPDLIKRHIYVVSEWCPTNPREIEFGDEIIVESQRPWQKSYPTGVLCKMNMTTSGPDVGLIVSILSEDTQNCEDFLRISTPESSDSSLYCGPRTNVTGMPETFINKTVHVEWTAIKRQERFRKGQGFQLLLTAFQNTCFKGQICFPCTNGLIIDQVHMCNGLNNCGDFSDEVGCHDYKPDPPVPKPSVGWSMGLMIALLCLSLMGVVGLAFVAFRLQRERDNLRQTRPGEARNLYSNEEEQDQADP